MLGTRLEHAEHRIENMREEAILSTEQLRAANEELQSLNEEYRSTTEELETSKEELQSTNEELQAVNQELKRKLDELSRAHGDLENLMAATNVATLFLNLDLRHLLVHAPAGGALRHQAARPRSADRRPAAHARLPRVRSGRQARARDAVAD